MDIKITRKGKVNIDNIPVGRCFLSDNRVYLKITPVVNKYNNSVICLSSQEPSLIENFLTHTYVTPLKSTTLEFEETDEDFIR